MKKTLLIVLIILLLALSVYIALQGFQIGKIEVLSYANIRQRNLDLDAKIQEASKLAEKDFKSMINDVEQNSRKLISEKNEYQNMVLISSENGQQVTGQIEKYKVETLWVKLGTYATSEGTILQMDIRNSSTGGTDKYDLYFEVNGSYIGITDFVSDIENDSMLGFKIEGFNIKEDTSSTDLVATFVCKDIAIQDVKATTNSAPQQEDTNNNTTNNTTSNTDTTSNADTTDSTEETQDTNSADESEKTSTTE